MVIFFGIIAIIVMVVIMVSKSGSEKTFEESNKEKCEWLEQRVYESIKKYAEEDGRYERYIRNAYIPLYDGNTTEVDLIAINEKGISVFESKYRDGKIGDDFTNPKDKYWDCIHFSYNRRKTSRCRLYSPIRQNYRHINAINEYLSKNGFEKPKSARNYVVFGGNVYICDSIFSYKYNGKVYNYNPEIGQRYNDDLKYNVKETSYTREQIDAIADSLEKNCCNVPEKIKKKHIRYVALKARYNN